MHSTRVAFRHWGLPLFSFLAGILIFEGCNQLSTVEKSSLPISLGQNPGSTSSGVKYPPGGLISYDAKSACINGKLYTNNVLPQTANAPAGVGEFGANGLDRTYWGGPKSRQDGSSWSGFMSSWGRHQYDNYFGDVTDGLGLDPFYIGPDTEAPGSPQGLRIMAEPMPSAISKDLRMMANDQWVVTSASAPFQVPSEGGSLSVNVQNPSSAKNGWQVGIGYQGAPVTFIGTLSSGGATPNTNNQDGTNPWTISNIHVYTGSPGTTITPGTNDEGGLRAYNFPQFYSGTLDTNVNQQYGLFVARVRLPQPAPGISPAFWMLETAGVGSNANGLLRSEWDIQEMFANDYGYNLNAGNILWNSGVAYGYNCDGGCSSANNTPGKGAAHDGLWWPSFETTNYNQDYHDFSVLISPPGPSTPPFPNSSAPAGAYVENNDPFQGTTFFVDGIPISGHIGAPDLTQGSPDKEVMLMFQVGSPGSWLDYNSQVMSNAWPLYYWVQWLRIYKPTSTPCS